MAIITRIRNGVKYLYESTYAGFVDGKTKHTERCLGKLELDANGKAVLIPSKKNRRKAMKDAPVELVIQTTTTRHILRKKKLSNIIPRATE